MTATYINTIKNKKIMKVKTINVQISKCPKQYEAVRLGMECEISDGENEQDAIKACHDELLQIYGDLYPVKKSNTQAAQEKQQAVQEKPAQAAQDKPAQAAANPATADAAMLKPKPEEREPLKFGDKRVQAVVRRIEKTPERAEEILAQALQYFNPDDETLRVWKLAAILNK